MGWINPTERILEKETELTTWMTLFEDTFFMTKQYQPHLDNSTNKPEFIFRILLRAKTNIIIAQENNLDILCNKWEWIEQTLNPQLEMFDPNESEEIFRFIILKLSSLSINQGGASTADLNIQEVKKTHQFGSQEFFSEIFEVEEKLIKYLSTTHWGKKVIRGGLYITRRHIGFISSDLELTLLFKFEEIMELRSATKLLPDSIAIVTRDQNEYVFSKLEKVGRIYTICKELWRENFAIYLMKIEKEMEEFSEESELAPQSITVDKIQEESKQINFDSIPSSESELLLRAENNLFHFNFTIPLSENLIQSCECKVGNWNYEEDIKGKVFASDHFICFHSLNGDFKLVIPTASIEKLDAGIAGKILVNTPSNTLFNFFAFSNNKVIQIILDKWKSTWTNDLIIDITNPSRISQRESFREKQFFFNDIVEDLKEDQQELWKNYSKKNGIGVGMIFTPQLLHLVRAGLPRRFRGQLWQMFSGAKYKQSTNPLEYSNLYRENAAKKTLAIEEIDRDLHRTFPEHPFYQKEGGISILRRVLLTYSFRNPQIGYCQSMNIVSAVLVLFMSEEEAYWTIATICEDLLPDYYGSSMAGSSADQRVFEILIKQHLPQINAHLEKFNIPIAMVTIPWLLCIFIGFLSWNTTLRILDCFFYEGRVVLFQIGLAILKINEENLLASSEITEVVEALKNTNIDCSLLFKYAFEEYSFLTAGMIEELHFKAKCSVIRELQSKVEKRRQTAAMDLRRSSVHLEPSPLPSPSPSPSSSSWTPSGRVKAITNSHEAPQPAGSFIGNFARKFNSNTSKSYSHLRSSDPIFNPSPSDPSLPKPRKKTNIFNFRSSKKNAIDVSPNFRFNDS